MGWYYGPIQPDKTNEMIGQDIGLCRFRGLLKRRSIRSCVRIN